MDASYKIQRGIHVHLIQFFMCPEFWVHIRMRSPMRSTPVPVGIITTTTAMPAAVTPMPGAARMTPLIQ